MNNSIYIYIEVCTSVYVYERYICTYIYDVHTYVYFYMYIVCTIDRERNIENERDKDR